MGMIEFNPEKRFKIKDIKNHPWTRYQIAIDQLNQKENCRLNVMKYLVEQ
jgi:hypothetical protein